MHQQSSSSVMFTIARIWRLYQMPKFSEETTYKGLQGKKGYYRLLKNLAYVDPPLGSHITDAMYEMLLRSWLFGIRTYMHFRRGTRW